MADNSDIFFFSTFQHRIFYMALEKVDHMGFMFINVSKVYLSRVYKGCHQVSNGRHNI